MKQYNDTVDFYEVDPGIHISEIFQLESIYGVSISVKWNCPEPITGNLVIQASVVPNPADDDWYNLPETEITYEGNDSTLYNLTNVFYNQLRIKFVVDGDVADPVLKANINSKGV